MSLATPFVRCARCLISNLSDIIIPTLGREYKIDKTSRANFQSTMVGLILRRVLQGGPVGSTPIGASMSGAIVELEHAEAATANLKSYDGRVADAIISATSSDICNTVVGYIDKVVQFGDAISQVSLFSKSPFSRCSSASGPSLCKARVADAHIRPQGSYTHEFGPRMRY
jgi:hypothetical protein